MNTYTIYLGATPIACADGTEYVYAVWAKTRELAELLTTTAILVWDDSGEVIEDYDPAELEYVEVEDDDEDDYYEPDVDECGFDPYEGCYTFDC